MHIPPVYRFTQIFRNGPLKCPAYLDYSELPPGVKEIFLLRGGRDGNKIDGN